MNEEEKKAIKMLDKFTTEHKFYNIKHSDNLEDNIEIVLNLIEKLQKENEELKADNYELNNRITDLLENISIQKVKDKIEELKAQYKTALEENSTEAFILKCQITILQELIEEREEK